MNRCPRGHPVMPGTAFCGVCGNAIQAPPDVPQGTTTSSDGVNPPIHCPRGHPVPSGATFCPQCGAPVGAAMSSGASSPETPWGQHHGTRSGFLRQPIGVVGVAVMIVLVVGVAVVVALDRSGSGSDPGSQVDDSDLSTPLGTDALESTTAPTEQQFHADFTQSGYAYGLDVEFLAPTRDDDSSACIVGAARTADSVAVPFLVRLTNDSGDSHAQIPYLWVSGPGDALVRDADGECGSETGDSTTFQYMDPDETHETRGSIVLGHGLSQESGLLLFEQGGDEVLRVPIPNASG